MSGGPHELHPLVAGFGDARIYDRGRPSYGEPVAHLLMEALELTRGDAVLELGAGTGQLSRALLAAGLELTAVEPLAETRELLIQAIGAEHVRDGVAEQIPMPDQSVRAVFAADAFHWFDEERAMGEIRRVLGPGGGVGILRTFPQIEEVGWSHELGEIVLAARPAHPAFGERGAAAALEEDPAFGPVLEREVSGEETKDRAGLLAYFASMSWVATLAPPERGALVAKAQELLERHAVNELTFDLRHEVWTARLL
jgi:SAM-dependent methyltransferase